MEYSQESFAQMFDFDRRTFSRICAGVKRNEEKNKGEQRANGKRGRRSILTPSTYEQLKNWVNVAPKADLTHKNIINEAQKLVDVGSSFLRRSVSRFLDSFGWTMRRAIQVDSNRVFDLKEALKLYKDENICEIFKMLED